MARSIEFNTRIACDEATTSKNKATPLVGLTNGV